MGKIVTIKDNITQESIYPVTHIDAVVTEEGNFKTILENKLEEINISLQNAVLLATAAEETVKTLESFGSIDIPTSVLSGIITQIETNTKSILQLSQGYEVLISQLNNTIAKSNVVSNVTSDHDKIPTSLAVRNYVINKTSDIMDNLINTTTIDPNYKPQLGGQILINEEEGSVFISNGDNWLKLKANKLILPEPSIETSVDNNVIDLFGDIELGENTEINLQNKENVNDDTLIL